MTLPSSISIPYPISGSIYLLVNSNSKDEVGSFFFNFSITDSAGYGFLYMMNVTLIDNCTIALFTAPVPTFSINYYLNHEP